MANGTLEVFVRRFSAARGRSDRELLARFAARRDEAAFAQIVGRYGRLVRHVCRHVLRSEQDAEDASQATFLLLARRAASLRRPGALAGWLHGAAYRTALHARRAAARRRAREASTPLPVAAAAAGPVAEAAFHELQAILDEELQRLPEKLRAPFALCCLEGYGHGEAARLLGWKTGTVSGRLHAAREQLRRRLARRGVSLSAVLCGLAVADNARACLPAEFAAATARAAVRFLDGGAAAAGPAGRLAGAVLRRGLAARGRVVALAVLAAGVLSAGVGAGLRLPAAPPGADATAPPPPVSPAPAAGRPRVDRFGDALPERAFARLGTRRFGHSFATFQIVWSPDGKILATLGGNSTGRRLCLWDAATGKELHELPAASNVFSAAFSPDGKTLAAAEAGQNPSRSVVLWDVASGKEITRFGGQPDTLAVAFAPNGLTLAAVGSDQVIWVRDVTSGEAVVQLKVHEKFVSDLAYAPDGRSLASASRDGTLRLWDLAKGLERWRSNLAGENPSGIAFAPDGKHLATSASDGKVRVWDATTGRELRSFGDGRKSGGRRVLAYSPDGRWIATPGRDGSVCLWDPATGNEVRRWSADIFAVFTIAFAPDGRTLATGGIVGSHVRLWDPATGKELRPVAGHDGSPTALAFAADGKTLRSYGQDKVVFRWDLSTGAGERLSARPAHTALDPADLSPDGQSVAIGGREDRRVRLLDTDGKELACLGTHDGPVCGVAFSRDGRLLTTGGEDGQIRLWDVESRVEVRRMEAPKHPWGRLAFSPDGRRLAAGKGVWGRPDDDPVHVFDAGTGKEVLRLDGVTGAADLAFSPDGRTLATAGDGRTKDVFLFDAATGKELGRCVGHTSPVFRVAFSPDGRLLATGGGGEQDNTVRVWEVATGRAVDCFTGHHGGVGALAFTPDGKTLASGAGDATILLWDLTGLAPDGRPHPRRLSPADLERCWKDLAAEDAATGYRAVWALASDTSRSVPFLSRQLRPVAPPEPARLARRLASLGADEFEVRQRAEAELIQLGDAAEAAVRKLFEGAPSADARKRAERILEALPTAPERSRARRAVAALEYAGTPEARRVLDGLAAGMPGARLTAEARAALDRLKEVNIDGR